MSVSDKRSSVTSAGGAKLNAKSSGDDDYPSSHSSPPPTLQDIDRWQNHISLQEFGEDLQAAAKAIFPNSSKTKYTNVFVLILSWEDEDPQLPVSIEIEGLRCVFADIYRFETDCWRIPDENSHYKLNQKVLDFVAPADDSKEHLKIVYYAGHGRLSRERTLLWISWRNNNKAKCPTVKWSGIQNVLEEAESDVLILLDCCASGVATTNSGNQSNELLAACAYNSRANGVGSFSFTHALAIELQFLSRRPFFTTGELYSNIFSRTQNRMPEEVFERPPHPAPMVPLYERHPAPVHLVLTHERPPCKSIQLSVLPSTTAINIDSDRPEAELDNLESLDSKAAHQASNLPLHPSTKLDSQIFLPKAPRIAFAVRLIDSIKASDLSVDLFVDWLREIPTSVADIKIEAGFDSFSTLLIISLPLAVAGYLRSNPAVVALGPITSTNYLLSYPEYKQGEGSQSRIYDGTPNVTKYSEPYWQLVGDPTILAPVSEAYSYEPWNPGHQAKKERPYADRNVMFQHRQEKNIYVGSLSRDEERLYLDHGRLPYKEKNLRDAEPRTRF